MADKEAGKSPLAITSATFGKVVDYGITDVNNMGAAMAPAACDTILKHLKDTGKKASEYDLILTGDLGALGSRILKDLTWEKGVDIAKNHVDCGEIIYNVIEDEFQGGSGAGCSALVFHSYIMDKLKNRELNKVLFDKTYRDNQIVGFEEVTEKLGCRNCAETTAQLIVEKLRQ